MTPNGITEKTTMPLSLVIAMVGLALALGAGWAVNRTELSNKVDEKAVPAVVMEYSKPALDLKADKVWVSENFVARRDMAEVKQQLARIEEKLDRMNRRVDNLR